MKLSGIARNLNQIAKRANTYGSLYAEEYPYGYMVLQNDGRCLYGTGERYMAKWPSYTKVVRLMDTQDSEK